MKLFLVLPILVIALSGCGVPQQPDLIASEGIPAVDAQTYSILVGAEDPANGAELEAFFPAELHIHPGDSVIWQQNASEPHTVTFSSASQLPELIIPAPESANSKLMFNPQVAFSSRSPDGTFNPEGLNNSGLMGRGQGEAPAFRLTFTKPGRYTYDCAVHRNRHTQGVIVVEDPSIPTSSPEEVKMVARGEIQNLLTQVPQVIQAAKAAQVPDVHNPDGTVTHHILVGYSKGPIDLRSFFPAEITAHPGDKVEWVIDKNDPSPHSITVLNREDLPPLVALDLQPGSRPLLLLNPAVADPLNTDQPIGLATINSGLLQANGSQPTVFSLQVGNVKGRVSYLCLIHNQPGSEGTVIVAPAD